jgi:hypothetical protein
MGGHFASHKAKSWLCPTFFDYRRLGQQQTGRQFGLVSWMLAPLGAFPDCR